MLYINSKEETLDLADLNDFHLKAAAQKSDHILNFMVGAGQRGDFSTFKHEEWGVIERYIKMIQANLWAEVKRRDLDNPVKAHFLETFPHLEEADKIALWNFMKGNFNPKDNG